MSAAAPPLPPGWTEHAAPDGTAYYHHRASGQSTYTRPVLPGNHAARPAPAPAAKPKEKPARKTIIPDTDGQWARVVTTAGNTFYTHLARKESVWTVPAEIAQQVAACEQKGWDEVERENEVERIRSELRAMGVEPGTEPMDEDAEPDESKAKKRKVHDDDEDVPKKSKKARVDTDDEDDSPKSKPKKALSVSEAAEATFGTQNVNLSLDEAKALFMVSQIRPATNQLLITLLLQTLLREKQINPLASWDSALPQLITDPRYALLPALGARREVFDDYCRARAREIREEKAKVSRSL